MPILANVIENAFSPLITLFESIMVFIHNNLVGGSWGLAIVGLTVTIRAVLVPLTFRQLKSMQEMQRLAPRINEIKERYKQDKQRQQEEIMKFYRENKINPLSSCLPLLLQIPVFISLFYMLRSDLKKHICGDQLVQYFNRHPDVAAKYHSGLHASSVAHLPTKFIEDTACNTVAPHSAKFLFIPDITTKATGIALVVLIIAYVGSQVASTLIATATADANQRRLMLALPIIFVIILYRYPAGLLVYWITTNLWTIGQQYLIKRHIGPPPTPAAAVTGRADGKSGRALKPALAGAGVAGAGAGGGSSGRGRGGRGTGNDGAGSDGSGGSPSPASAPPRPPRKKKKRSGRRR
jgi:YidC/Oxa1 family membrane protein insertase